MLNTVLAKIEGLFDRRFVQVYWLPVFVATMTALFLRAWAYGLDATWVWWQALGPAKDQKSGDYGQIWILLTVLVLVTVIAYLLEALTRPLVQLVEGYWPLRLRRLATHRVKKRWNEMRTQRADAVNVGNMTLYTTLQDRLYHEYPTRENQLMPTRLGNVFRAAEEYAGVAYGMDTVFWWPRLWPLLPEAVRKDIDASLTPVLALINLATLFLGVTCGGAIYLTWTQTSWWPCIITVAVGAVVIAASYWGASAQAWEYGQHIRMAIDLYRFDLIEALHQPLPETPREERALWDRLSRWLYNQDRGAVRELTYKFQEKKRDTP